MRERICEHDKVYNTRMTLTSYPPQQAWICRKCGATGIAVIGNAEADEYERVYSKFHKEKT